jgi:hypothetical protein
MWRIEFSTRRFAPYLPENSQVNPGTYGFELAHWLSTELAKRGVITSYPSPEDWGWMLEYVEGEIEIAIGCSSHAREGDGYAGGSITWTVFVKPNVSIKHKLKGIAPEETVRTLARRIEALLEEAGITPKQ